MSCIYPNEAFYVISGFSIRTDLIGSAFNFATGLVRDFALKAYNTKLPFGMFERLNDDAKNTIKSLGEKSKYIKNPYGFAEDKNGNLTTLLRWCCVPGDACELGIDGFDFDCIRDGRFNHKMLIYEPHNIDSRTQAYSLLSIWLNWADVAYVLTDKK